MGSDLSRFTGSNTGVRKAPRKAGGKAVRLGGVLQASSKANCEVQGRSNNSAERPGGDENHIDENCANNGKTSGKGGTGRCPPSVEQQCRKRSARNLEVLDGVKKVSALDSAQGTPGTRWPIEGGMGWGPLGDGSRKRMVDSIVGGLTGVSDGDVSDLGSLRLEERTVDEQGTLQESESLHVVWEVPFEECLEKLQGTRTWGHHNRGKLARRRLMWIPKDHDDDTLSLYLECVSCKPQGSAPVMAKFNLSVNAHETFSTELGGEDITRNECVEHTFTCDRPVCGAQRFVKVCDLQNHQSSSSLIAEMRITWCRDTYLFPPRSITISESNPEMYLVSTSPRILIVENFLNVGECEKIIGLARPLVKRSRVSTGTETPSRTSSSMFFTRGLESEANICAVEGKISQLMQRDDIRQGRRFEKSEALQAVKYCPGQFYSEHYDNRAGHAQLRAATIICYLSDVDAGGATYFPKSCGIPSDTSADDGDDCNKHIKRRQGVRIYPKRGRGLLFWSRLPNGEEDRASLHGGEPVIRGEKWIATRWFKEIDELKNSKIEE